MISFHYNPDGTSQQTSVQGHQQPGSHMLHQQNSMYTHVSPTFGAPYTSDDSLINNSNQLVRSKSLNDISNDYQNPSLGQVPSAHLMFDQIDQNFGGDSVNFAPQRMVVQENLNNSSPRYDINEATVNNANSLIYNTYNQPAQQQQQCTRNNFESIRSNDTNLNNHEQFNMNPNLNWNINANGNECSSNKIPTQSMPTVTTRLTPTSNPSQANMLNICNPLAMNLNGVTEQIGNLRL